MAEPKTQQNRASVKKFLASVDNETRRRDCQAVVEMMSEITGEPAKMWGTAIIGFGSYHYKYDSGREGDWPLTGVSPRKQSLTLYIMAGFSQYEKLLAKLGKHKAGKSCLYVNKLEDIDTDVLRELIRLSAEHTRASHS